MKPILVQIGPFPVSSFGLFLILSFVVGIAVARRRSARVGIDPSQMLDIGLYMIIGGIIVGRLGFALTNLQMFAQAPLSILTIWKDSGLTFYGALIGGLLVAAAYARSRRIPLRALLDVCAPALAVAYAVAMIGAFLHGLYLGKPTDAPWAVEMLLDRRHPTQLYLLLASLGTYQILRAQERQEAPAGVLFFLWLLLFSLSRVAVEIFVESPTVLGPLTMAQVANLAAALVAVVGLLLSTRRPLEPEAPPPATAGLP
ncbi:MAG TPA: prolipoprotein diacylglyceryl transferase family protein [bacterium]